MADATMLEPPAEGFADPVLDAADCFRAVMAALASPGDPTPLPRRVPGPSSLGPEAAAIALTLCDLETPVWLHPDLTDAESDRYLAFHCGCPRVAEPAAAAFAFLPVGAGESVLPELSVGEADYPDRAATAILLTPAMTGGVPARLSGPGLAAPRLFAPAGADEGLWRRLRDNAARFPLGVDCFFAGDGAVAGLPRSTAIEFSRAESKEG